MADEQEQVMGDGLDGDDETILVYEGSKLSLADIANIPMDQVEAVRKFIFPSAVCTWIGRGGGLRKVKRDNGVEIYGYLDMQCENVLSMDKDAGNPQNLVGKPHQEMIRFQDLKESVGRIKAFLEDCGTDTTGKVLQEMMASFDGVLFDAQIRNFALKNDTDQRGCSIGLAIGSWKIQPRRQAAA